MNFLEQIRTRIHERLLRNELATASPVARSSVSLEMAGSIGILFDGTQPEDREKVLRYAAELQQQGKKVKRLAYFDQELKSEDFTFKHFNKKQLDWAMRPTGPDVDVFTQYPFDLLLNLSGKSILPLDFIAARSLAKFRVGPSTPKTFCYDLMIEHPEGQGLQKFLQQVAHYLKNMHPGTTAAAV